MGDWKRAVCYTIFSFVFFCLYSGFSTVWGQEEEEINPKKLFEYHCATCHGENGKGTKRGRELKAPDLADSDWQAQKKDEEILNSIINGKNKMPRWSDKLKPEEIQALAGYVRKLVPKKRT
ncbi:MAG: cytochrome c [Candidatus Brocadia sp. AMX2]|uniref:Cytochrome c mono- and diheme variants n=1 Tax=Candidatus Brocadia sinica JPN1 TaxID=1197129 RepID=A0ABQ0JXH1_9BACT|nr:MULTISPECIES: cytochrome c [Brocadia]KXK29462.1 MAG: cytochrome c oxidase [Candidatus Brocadia sinica]MBC6932046.1 cytochrome c [Candidatus Brocadia sp.]MBL1169499.1 cytochrome c [Candidatus Brocadia sp. AMX1]NOG40788.1 cytochrome c [Planctomycetota bacterium]KAA0242672.1 MAG: cytochrome c [Candidatus Brocadia sp. AMX2]